MTIEEKRQVLISFCEKREDCFTKTYETICPLTNANCDFDKLPDEIIEEYYEIAFTEKDFKEEHRYCPNCGAKMDLEEQNNA